jgi:hypothetical protein
MKSTNSGSSGQCEPGQFAREAAFFDVEEREEAVAPSSTAAQKNCVVWTRSSRLRAYNGRREVLGNGMNRLR